MVSRWRFRLFGRVQNVGLRYRAYMLAKEFPVTGGIQNLDDGSVEMEVQGEKADVDKFVKKVRKLRYVDVKRMETSELPATAENGFRMWN